MNKKSIGKVATLCSLVLCVAALIFGIYALNYSNIKQKGKIGFRAHNCEVMVYGVIDGAITNPDDDDQRPTSLYLVDYTGGNFVTDKAFLIKGSKELTFDENLWAVDASNQGTNVSAVYFDDITGVIPDIQFKFYLKNTSAFPVSVNVSNVEKPDGINYEVTQSVERLEKNEESFTELVITFSLGAEIKEIDPVDVNLHIYIDFERIVETA